MAPPEVLFCAAVGGGDVVPVRPCCSRSSSVLPAYPGGGRLLVRKPQRRRAVLRWTALRVQWWRRGGVHSGNGGGGGGNGGGGGALNGGAQNGGNNGASGPPSSEEHPRRPQPHSLTGRFVPLDSAYDEEIRQLLHDERGEGSVAEKGSGGNAANGVLDSSFVDEGHRDKFGDVRDGLPRLRSESKEGEGVKWNKRAEAAKQRWANPEYRKTMMEKRVAKKQQRSKQQERKHRVEIGSMDSITLSSDDKAAAINAYARANQLRSEKLEKHHRDKQKWMEDRLSSGQEMRERLNNEEYKKERQARRKETARVRSRRLQEAPDDTEASDDAEEGIDERAGSTD